MIKIYLIIIFVIMGVVSEMDYRDHANTPNYVSKVCAGLHGDYRESKPDCD